MRSDTHAGACGWCRVKRSPRAAEVVPPDRRRHPPLSPHSPPPPGPRPWPSPVAGPSGPPSPTTTTSPSTRTTCSRCDQTGRTRLPARVAPPAGMAYRLPACLPACLILAPRGTIPAALSGLAVAGRAHRGGARVRVPGLAKGALGPGPTLGASHVVESWESLSQVMVHGHMEVDCPPLLPSSCSNGSPAPPTQVFKTLEAASGIAPLLHGSNASRNRPSKCQPAAA